MSGVFTDYCRVHDAISNIYDPERADTWMNKPNRAFGGSTPHEAIIHGHTSEVIAHIDRLAGGPKVDA